MLRFLGYMLLLVVVAVVLLLGDSKFNHPPDQNAVDLQALAAQALPVTITTPISEYGTNEVRADALYKGKLLKVEGQVIDVKTLLGTPYIDMTIEQGMLASLILHQAEPPTLTAEIRGDAKDSLINLHQGSVITLIGYGDGADFEGHVALKGAFIQPSGSASPPPPQQSARPNVLANHPPPPPASTSEPLSSDSPDVFNVDPDHMFPADVERMLVEYGRLDDDCRGGGTDPTACKRRDKVGIWLQRHGVCWNVEDVVESDAKWGWCKSR
jgi:hypothetical protein